MSAERLTAGMGADVRAAVSPDGTRVAFTTERRLSRLWVFPFDPAAGRLTGEGRPVTPEEGIVEGSDLSPDGRRVAYLLRRPGIERKDLWMVDVESGRHDVLAQSVVGFCWSRDSQSIAYSLFRLELREWALAARALSGPERLLSPWSSESALLPGDWVPDGAAIAGTYHAPIDSDSRLALWPAATPSQKPVRILAAERGLNLWQPRYSPDGRWLVFVATRTGAGEGAGLMVSPASGAPASRWVRLAADHPWADKPRWAPDGRTLYFLSNHGGAFFNLWGVRFDPARGQAEGEAFQITRFDSPRVMLSPDIDSTDAGISADRALLTLVSVTGNIWMLDNVDR
jgi:Tol biopolymer transport system component